MATRRVISEPPLTPEQQAALDAEIERAEREEREFKETEAEREFSFEDELRELSNGKIRVSRVAGGSRGAPGGYCFTCDAGDYSLDQLMDRIRDEYGGGKYRLRVYGQGGLKMNREIDVIESARKVPDPATGAIPVASVGDRFSDVLLMMQENSRQQAEAARQQMEAMQQMQMRQSEQNQAMLLGIIQSMNSRPSQEGLSVGDALALAKTLAPPAVDPMEKFLQGVQFGKEMGASEADKSPLQTLAENALGPLIELGKLGAMQRPPMPAPAQPMPRKAPELPAPQGGQEFAVPEQQPENIVENQEPQDMNLLALAQWQPLLNMCYTAAQQDADPDTYANLILDQVGIEAAQQLLADDDNYEKLMTLVPVLQPYRQWFDDLKGVVLELIRQETDASDDSKNGLFEQSGSANLPGEQLSGPGADADETDA